MSVKGKFGILISACVVVVSALFLYMQKEPYSTETVLEFLWDEYGVQSMQFGEEGETDKLESIIRIDIYDENDIPKVEQYLEKRLSKEDLTKFEIDIFSNGDRDSYENL